MSTLTVSANPGQIPAATHPKVSTVTVSGGTPPYSLAVAETPPDTTVSIEVIDANAGTFKVTITGATPGEVMLTGEDGHGGVGQGSIQIT